MSCLHIVICPLSSSQIGEFDKLFNSSDTVIYLDHIACDFIRNIKGSVPISKLSHYENLFPNNFFSTVVSQFKSRDGFKFSAYSISFYENFIFNAVVLVNYIEENKEKYDKTIVYGIDNASCSLPAMFFKSKELNKGSSLIVGSFLSSVFRQIDVNSNFIFVNRTRSLLCRPTVRALLVFVFEFLASCVYLNKIAFLKISMVDLEGKIGSGHKTPRVFIYLSRVKHQFITAVRMIDAAKETFQENSVIYVVPQARQGNILNLVELLRPFRSRVITPSFWRTLFPFFTSIVKSLCCFLRKKTAEFVDVEIGSVRFTLDLSLTKRELNLLLSDDLYSHAIRNLLETTRSEHIDVISFSMKGRYTLYEYDECSKLSIPLNVVQTASLDDKPCAIFPSSNKFYVDSRLSLQSLKYGLVSFGDILYKGAPYSLMPPKASIELSRVSYFTQPYELSITKTILTQLQSWCDEKSISLIVKLHPRDSEANYSECDGLKFYKDNILVQNVIKESDLVITRTSSIILESISLGVPVIPFLFSVFDRNFNINYLNELKKNELCAKSFDEFISLHSSEKLKSSVSLLQCSFFDNKQIENLVEDIYK